jgi:hypothetical protein
MQYDSFKKKSNASHRLSLIMVMQLISHINTCGKNAFQNDLPIFHLLEHTLASQI